MATQETPSLSRLGIFGGSFDPVHKGHMLLAECCLEQANLDCVWFIPTAHQPLKPRGSHAEDEDRLAMLQLVCDQRADFEASRLEIDRGGVSYTAETLNSIHQQHPGTKLFFLMGADSLAEFPRWYQPEEIARLATLLVVCRAGSPEPNYAGLENLLSEEARVEMRENQVAMPATLISSSEIRNRISTDGDWEEFVEPQVADYIHKHGLYHS